MDLGYAWEDNRYVRWMLKRKAGLSNRVESIECRGVENLHGALDLPWSSRNKAQLPRPGRIGVECARDRTVSSCLFVSTGLVGIPAKLRPSGCRISLQCVKRCSVGSDAPPNAYR
jgi:hypothetical protein